MKFLDRFFDKALEQAAARSDKLAAQARAETPGFDPAALQRLRDKSVLVIGAGGLGTAAAPFLAAAAVPYLQICDFGGVESETLASTPFYNRADIRRRKVEVVANRLNRQRPETQVHALAARSDEDFLDRRLPNLSIVVDATGDPATQQATNASCRRHSTPWVVGQVSGAGGWYTTLRPDTDGGPCLACLADERSATEVDDRPYPAALAGMVGSAMAMAALRVLMEDEDPVSGTPLVHRVDAYGQHWEVTPAERRENCPVCGC